MGGSSVPCGNNQGHSDPGLCWSGVPRVSHAMATHVLEPLAVLLVSLGVSWVVVGRQQLRLKSSG